MPRARRAPLRVIIRALLPVLSAAGCASHRSVAPPEPLPVDVHGPRIIRVDPPTLDAHVPARVKMHGSGFAFGAEVEVAGERVRSRVDDVDLARAALPALPPGRYDVLLHNPDGRSASLRQALVVRQRDVSRCDALSLDFAPDSVELSAEERSRIETLAWCWDARDEPLLLHAHVDEHLPVELALGMSYSRGEAVARALAETGVEPARLRVLPYGAEVGERELRGQVELVASESGRPRYGLRFGPYRPPAQGGS